MKTIWNVVKRMKATSDKIEKLKELRYDINAESHAIIKAMSDEEVIIMVKKAFPWAKCHETSGPYDDYYIVQTGHHTDESLGSGDTEKEAWRCALREYVWRSGQSED